MGFKRRGGGDFATEMASIVPKLFSANEKYCVAHGIDPYQTFEEALAPPCTESEIEALEAFLAQRLPPSYRAFLSVFGGWEGVPGCGGADLLGPAGHRDAHVRSTLSWKSDMFNEFEPRNPIALGALPLAIGDDRNMILLEPPMNSDGEMAVVKYYLTTEEGRFKNLLEYFEDQLRQHQNDA